MLTNHRAELASIKRFDQLVRYLRDEMGWPIEADNFEELTFEYTTEELGIDAKNAAKIQEIKRLRPFSPKQPWGIFFVKFEPKRLPVVALRRILSQVALKKRASANSSERAAWAKDDLLFVSNYGEGDERRISFAHFSQAESGQDLPTLKVLGWDNLDTPLHLDDVAEKLSIDLAWPDNPGDVDSWRQQWRSAFTLRHREVITTSRDLSIRLAELARTIRDRIKTALAIETERGPLTRLMKAFQESLVHDLDVDGFADMYAQTIAYGLLSARIANPHAKTADDFAGHMRTNPFLKELIETFLKVGGRRGKAGGSDIDFDELGVNEVVELLNYANMEAVVRDFGDRNPQEDPVIHFYELFLKEYDAKKRMQRGVFYTPRPVVSYIVRSVDELLRTEFNLEDGLADTTTWGEMTKRHEGLEIPEGVPPEQSFVQILDPATGTGTFPSVWHADLWGLREGKYKVLAEGVASKTGWQEVAPSSPDYFFFLSDGKNKDEYADCWSLPEIMPVNVTGVVSSRDEFVIDFSDEAIRSRMEVFIDTSKTDAEVQDTFDLSENYAWRIRNARNQLRSVKNWRSQFIPYHYRPFDLRRILYNDAVVWRRRDEVMRHMLGAENLALVVGRSGAVIGDDEWNIVEVSRSVTDFNIFRRGGGQLHPLFLMPDAVNPSLVLSGDKPRPNMSPAFLKALWTRLCLSPPATSDFPEDYSAEHVFFYIVAILHSHGYRQRYAAFLMRDFPRLPLPGSLDLFRDLTRLGSELVALHLMESPKLDHFLTTYTGPKNPEAVRVGWSDDTVWLDAAATKKGQSASPGTIGFRGVPEAVWNFHIGGYQVCEKWLKDRKGRTLSKEDLAHYQKIVVALNETIRLMQEIDEVIEVHGGWPGAFAPGDLKGEVPRPEASEEEDVVPLTQPMAAETVYQADLLSQPKAAETETRRYETADAGKSSATRIDPNELDREDLICRIRQMFSGGQEREREAVIDALARELGYQRTGPRIREELDNALRVAVRRGVLQNERGALRLLVRTIEDYERDFLKEQFLASLSSRGWIERDEAIRGFARWMGFQRTGPTIDETARSLINGLLRVGRLESDNGQIRRGM